MARQADGPWYRASKNSWYATLNGQKVALGVRGGANRPEAVKAWHRLMGGLPVDPPTLSVPTPKPKPSQPLAPTLTVDALAGLFLADATARLKPQTVRQYTDDLTRFRRTCGRLEASAVSPATLTRWLAGMTCGSTTRGVRLRSVSACFGWAVRMGHLEHSPTKRVDRPRERSRGADAVVSEQDHVRLMACASPAFRRVLTVLRGTGCRPGEAARITSAAVRDGVAVLREHKCDGHGRPRLIVLPPDVAEMLTGLAAANPTGPLLRTSHGRPWTGRSITQAMGKVRAKCGLRTMAYGYRHGYATDALAAGVPDATVAALLGHAGTQMLHKHYSHLTSRTDVLRQAAARVR